MYLHLMQLSLTTYVIVYDLLYPAPPARGGSALKSPAQAIEEAAIWGASTPARSPGSRSARIIVSRSGGARWLARAALPAGHRVEVLVEPAGFGRRAAPGRQRAHPHDA